ncbi:MAG TPA: YciI family protein [Actinopolymorphaceae bacterium]|nr:YciI family protein [Actinopolymorphaceae bacterium]
MPSYVFLIYEDEVNYEDTTPEQWNEMMKIHTKFAEDVVGSGAKILGGEALQPTGTARTRRRRADGQSVVTDGPFAEVKESLGGFYIIEAADLDAALALAEICPGPTVEVRPVLDVSSER